MVKAAPGLFSMTMVCPRMDPSSVASSRASTSVALPGACGTIRRIGFSGNAAEASPGNSHAVAAISSAPIAWARRTRTARETMPSLPLSTDFQRNDLAACQLESIAQINRTPRKLASQVRGDDRAVSDVFRGSDLGVVAVLAPGLLRPDANGAAAMDIAPLVAHDGIVGKAGGDAVGIIGIGCGEIIGDDLWHLHGTIPPCASSVCARQGSTGLR